MHSEVTDDAANRSISYTCVLLTDFYQHMNKCVSPAPCGVHAVCVLHLDFHVGLGYQIEKVTGN